jgi:hypothetical protein
MPGVREKFRALSFPAKRFAAAVQQNAAAVAIMMQINWA